jgi:hypothetical protein
MTRGVAGSRAWLACCHNPPTQAYLLPRVSAHPADDGALWRNTLFKNLARTSRFGLAAMRFVPAASPVTLKRFLRGVAGSVPRP